MNDHPLWLRRTLLLISAFVCSIAAQTVPDRLELDKTLERDLKGGESDHYDVFLAADQFLRVKTEQMGIDVVVTLVGPDGTTIFEADGPNGTQGEEPLLFVATAPGQYRIRISSLDSKASAGRYAISLIDLRQPTTKDLDEAARFIGNRARDYRGRDNPKVRVLANQSIRLARLAGSRIVEGNQLSIIGTSYLMEGNLLLGLEFQHKGLAIFEELGAERDIAFTLNNIAIANSQLGNNDEVIASFIRCADVMLKLNLKSSAAVMTYNVGTVYRAKADFARSMAYYQKSAELFSEAGVKAIPPDLAVNLADLYFQMGDFDQAATLFGKARVGFEATKNNYGLNIALQGLGGILQRQGNNEAALDFFLQANAVQKRMNAKVGQGLTLNHGDAYFFLGDKENAEKYYQEALSIALAQGDEIFGIRHAVSMSRLRLSEGKAADAITYAEKAVLLQDKYPQVASNFELFLMLGKAYAAVGRKDFARQAFLRSIEVIESQRESSSGDSAGLANFFTTRMSPYHSLIAADLSNKNESAAFFISERAKSRTVIEALQGNKIDIDAGMTPHERRRQRQIKNELASLNAQASRQAAKIDTALEKAIRDKRLELEDFRARTLAAHPDLQMHRGEMQPISIENATELCAGQNAATVEFTTTDEMTFVLNLSRAGLSARSITVSKSDLEKKVGAYTSALASGDLSFQVRSRELYDLLLKPIEKEFAGKSNLIIVPDGPLWDLPFQALMDEKGKYLIEKAAVSYAPSLTALQEMQKKAKARKPSPDAELLAFGNPTVGVSTKEKVQRVFMSEKLEPIPEAERLVNELGKMYGPKRSKIFTGAEASEETAKKESPKYRIVQFATHGILNNVSPMYSHLVFAQNNKDPNEDGLLEAWELKDLDLKADMVILSACDTARGRIANGEGVIGMTWASFIAGAPTTVASQWKVESSSTTELMLEFHRQLLSKKPPSKAEALRRASLKLMKMPKYRHPSYWAGFIIVGDAS